MKNEKLGRICKDCIPCYKALVRKTFGFVLIELIGVLSLISILLGIWFVPAYKQLLEEMRLEIKARQLLLSLKFARTVAMQRCQKIVLCKSSDSQFCSGDWKDGWIVLAALPKKVLKITKGLYSNQSLTFYGAGQAQSVEFSPLGMTKGYNGRFVLCSKNSKVSWFILVSPTGRARLEASYDLSYCDQFS